MKRALRLSVVVLAVVAGANVAAGAGLAAPTGRAAGSSGPDLDLYRITAPPAAVSRLEEAGYDVAATRPDGRTE
ncbi:MAG: hypothetical protein QOJ23_1584, partial [Actinomycetota bacterium]|nr:hypothetical protein [Actinomycetota bacterium]